MRFLVVPALVVLFVSATHATVLYDGSVNATPESLGYLLYIGPGATPHGSASSITTLDTTSAHSVQAGWGRNPLPGAPAFPTMDRSGSGYVVSFDMKVLAQSTTNNDRAGISLIALSSDHQGVEIAFFENEVWAYSFASPDVFTHGEGHLFDTKLAMTRYDLAIHGTTYELFAGGASILSGNLRDYSDRGAPYTINNFISIGDDTTESKGSFEFSRLEVGVPEPGMIGVALLGLVALRRRGR